MATNPKSGVLRRLEAEVTCPLCLEIFTEPKKLPCEHIYCKQCLLGLALRSITGSINCPECHTDTPVPPNFDVTQFVTPHQVNRLIEMYQQNLKLAENEASAPQPATCKVHKSQALALYCETCESLVCRDCVLLSCAKKNHEHGFVEDMMKKYQTDLSKRLEPVQMLHQQMLNALEEISTRERQVENMKEVRLRQTEVTFDALAEVLAQERRYFTESVKKSFEEQEKINSSKKIEISKVSEKLQSIIQCTESSLLNEPMPTFLGDVVEKKRNIELVEKIASKVSPQPAVLPQMQVELMDPAKFKEDCHNSNYMYKMGDPLKSYFDRSADLNDLQVPINQTSTYTLHIDPSDVKVTVFQKITITARLHCLYDGSSEPVLAKKITPKQYSLSFVPHKRGRHELRITYNDTHICGSPIPVYVTIQPHQLKPIAQRKFEKTAGITCYGGKIHVCNPDGGLCIFKSLTKRIEKSRTPGLSAVLVTQEHLYGTISEENRVVKMDMNGSVIKSIGEEGRDAGEFRCPIGIRMSKEKDFYVCDIQNNRIQVFDEHLEIQRVLSNDFDMPIDLDFDEVGNLYVVDAHNDRIQVLTPEGQLIHNIGTPGAGPGELDFPISPAIHKNMLYLTDTYNNRISVFKTTGEFITTFGEGIVQPQCISIDEDGYIYVSSNDELVTVF